LPSKKIYQQFIRKTAAEGKSIVAWDASRRYEGVFKQFDPTGEFVVLTNVWVSEGQETIFVSEMLLPLESLTIVSAGLPIESFEEETYEEFGSVYPIEAQPETEPSFPQSPATAGDVALNLSEAQKAEEPLKSTEKPEESPSETAPFPEPTVSKLINLPTATPPSTATEAQPAQTPSPSSQPSSTAAVSTAGTEISVSAAPAGKEAFEKSAVASASLETPKTGEKKEEKEPLEEKTAPIQKVKAGFGKVPGFFQKIFSRKPREEYTQDVARKIPPTPAYQASRSRRAVPPMPSRPVAPVTPPPTAHPQVIQRRSAQVSASSFFTQPVPAQATIPKQKVDLGTLILDILIGILTLVVIAIVAMGFLGIKIPSLPF